MRRPSPSPSRGVARAAAGGGVSYAASVTVGQRPTLRSILHLLEYFSHAYYVTNKTSHASVDTFVNCSNSERRNVTLQYNIPDSDLINRCRENIHNPLTPFKYKWRRPAWQYFKIVDLSKSFSVSSFPHSIKPNIRKCERYR